MANAVRSADHLVIGGGLAGSMVALRLASAGRRVTLLERELTAHHKVCGEFLSREAVGYLEQAGIDLIHLGGQPIRVVRLITGARTIESPLPFPALSISRSLLDEALLARAVAAGCDLHRGCLVESLVPDEGRWCATLRNGEAWSAPVAFLATGKHDLRGHDRPRGVHGDLTGFKLHLRLAPKQTRELREAMELYLFPGGYGGISLVENEVANLCLVIRRAHLRKVGGWTQLFKLIQDRNAYLAQRLEDASALWERPLAVSSIPYGHLDAGSTGLWNVGDQAACIPSFTGDGMSIALHSSTLAARIFLSGGTAAQYHERLRAHLRRPMSLATAMSRAIVTPVGRALAPAALSLHPGSLAWIARSTRIPANAIDPLIA